MNFEHGGTAAVQSPGATAATGRQRAPRHRLVAAFIALYLLVQIGVPVAGLYVAHSTDKPLPFSWHMFSRLAEDRD